MARSFWITEAVGSLFAIILVFDKLTSTDTGRTFILAEFGLFAVAFVATVLSERAGTVLTVGVGIGFLFATVAALAASGRCSEGDAICFSPGEVFVFCLIIAGALYPGWALGAGVAKLVRGASVEGSNR